MKFKLKSKFSPAGDQPQAIAQLAENFDKGVRHQTLLGVTGSGKTFTMANVIAKIQKPVLIISHNKTLAAQLYQEFKKFFPENAVHYFVSYYDYYQPEAYIPQTDTYIGKDSKINEKIDALRHAATSALLSRKDVIVVASVSCIYGLGNPEEYENISLELKIGDKMPIRELTRSLALLQYSKNPIDPYQGHFRLRDNRIEIYSPSGLEKIFIELKANKIQSIYTNRSATANQEALQKINSIKIFPAKHFITPENKLRLALLNIKRELKQQIKELKKQGKILEAARLKQRTEFDLEMLLATGYVTGIENYSRHLDFRQPGTPPYTLLDYFIYSYQKDFLVFIDESHVTIPQIRGMYQGDYARKKTLIDYGFRLPSALDNRPLKFTEFNQKIKQLLYISATPGDYEIKKSYPYIVEQIIRPTGILDPKIEIRPTRNQMRDVVKEVKKRVKRGQRSLVMALTKRLAENIAEYLQEQDIKAKYLHSEIKTLDRPELLHNLREGKYDAIVGINLLREGLDLPEVSFIAILDADKEGFLRNETTLLQIIGRAARHIEGTVILYADKITESIKKAVKETERRRKIQQTYNRYHRITPKTIAKELKKDIFTQKEQKETKEAAILNKQNNSKIIQALQKEMQKASRQLNFELAAKIRDQIKKLQGE